MATIKKFHGVTISLYLDGTGGESSVDMYCENSPGTAWKCPWAMSDVMPLEEDAHCVLKSDGRCPVVGAKVDALKRARSILAAHIKELEEQMADWQ